MAPQRHPFALIVDLGMNNGDDTHYYLKRAERVVAVEANPGLCAAAAERFAQEIAEGRLVIVHAAIQSGDDPQRATFFVNDHNHHWSSLDLGWAGREDSAVRPVEVPTMSVRRLFELHGVPDVLKVDVEGADEDVLDGLARCPGRPRYLSIEDCRFGFQYLEKMAALGYGGFKLLDQSTVPTRVDPAVDHQFPAGSSGPLGEAIEGPWLDSAAMEEHYAATVRDRQGHRHAPRTHWWDIHARLGGGA